MPDVGHLAPYTVGELRQRLGQFPNEMPVVFSYRGLRSAFPGDTVDVERWDEIVDETGYVVPATTADSVRFREARIAERA